MAEAAAWYDDRVAGLGERFLLEVEAAFVRSFPYSAAYILEPRLVIVALVHARRRPGYWVKRLSEV